MTKSSDSRIDSTICSYCAAFGEPFANETSQYSGWCRSAKPPSVSARMKLSVSAARSYARSISSGSGSRSAARERVAVDEVAAVRGQRDVAARLDVGRARLRVLARDAADADHRLARAVHEHERHLQQDLQLRGDRLAAAVVEALGAVAALQHERVAARRARELAAQLLDLPRRDERRQPADLVRPRARARRRRRSSTCCCAGCALPARRASTRRSFVGLLVPSCLQRRPGACLVVDARGARTSFAGSIVARGVPCAAASRHRVADDRRRSSWIAPSGAASRRSRRRRRTRGSRSSRACRSRRRRAACRAP